MSGIADTDFEYEELMSGKVFKNNKPFKALMLIFKGNIHRLLISYAFFLIKHSSTWVMPIVLANIVNIVTSPQKHSLNELWINLAVGVVVVVQNVPTSVLYNRYLSIAVRNVEAELRSNLVRKLQMLSISFYKQFESGKIQSKIIRDVEAIVTLARQISNTVVPIIINIIVVLCITLTKSPLFALMFLIAMPLTYFVIHGFRKNIRLTNSDFRHQIENMSSRVTEMIEMVPVTRAHALEDVEISRMDSQLRKIRKAGYRLDILTAFFGASSWICTQIMQLVCLGVTGFLAFVGRITVGDVVLYQNYFTQILSQITSLVNVYPDIMKGFESVRSVSELFLADDIEVHKGREKLSAVKGDFEFKNVVVKYPSAQTPSLNGFDLHIKAGEKVAFVGESGAGKTTILNLIIGFIKPTSGTVLIDGRDMSKVNLSSLRSHVAFVPQNVILFPGTIRENITYGMENVSEEKLARVVELANLDEVTRSLPQGLDTKIGEHGDTLSGGQKQRITIARAMIRDPEIIILDEATSALDSVSEACVQNAIDALTKGRTTLIVAHRLTTVRTADRIVLMNRGRCVESGNYDELMDKKGLFYKMKTYQA